ncbi:MAG: UDP-3-O-(3-hydroxymyristoyl)glucosamine N-acyltransferase [Alphaproteobacteria bacterium]|nr:UDP-3-O-(3-hydroxymyristoyl)glucosamine N-acyltransferase [Alphaproteobacteria bacterium]
MADPRFYKKNGPFTLADLAKVGQCDIGRGDPALLMTDVASLNKAESSHIALCRSGKYVHALENSKASACILPVEMAEKAPPHLAILIAKYPHRSFALISAAFYPEQKAEERIDPTAVIHPTAKLGQNVEIGPMAVIGAHAELGDGVKIGPLTAIGEGVGIGAHSIIGSHVSLSHAVVGHHVHIKPGARIGQSGFGFFMDPGDMGGHVPVPQLGRVIINDFVEIGANTTVDRGSGEDTIIGLGTRIDNLVQIAHNVHFGKGCVMVAQVGIAGSTKFGDYVAAGGQAGFTDNLKIGTGARLGAQSGIMRDVHEGEALAGSPAMPIKAHYRQIAMLKRLVKENQKKINSR